MQYMSRCHRHICSGTVCRKCINEIYGLKLHPYDCKYFFYPTSCSVCMDVCNIITGLTITGWFKLFWASLFHKIRKK